ncbi:hypothetical protein L6164_014322 [Bauhinia variegata]|uniref:Uncharacterized protein n=1 Tax=Bauhinia variegata TaxID=167791 RepID=A0ACB9NH67_BAUVA|nr:hypothetical protein L6164_014322 [Bauhinia variegata]
MDRRMIFILGIAVCALLQNTNGQKVHTVGNELGWTIPPGGPIAYDTWASLQDFNVGDILLFNFTNGEQDVAQVTKEAFKTCNTTNPIWSSKNSPANFTLSAAGEYYFTSTIDRHCVQGQRLAIHVPGPEPSPSPEPSRGPVNYTVGDKLGWIVPPAGDFAYAAWAHWKTFLVGDTLVFYFVNGTQDVAVVTKEAYDNCDTNNTIAVHKNSPTYITLKTSGEHFYTSTYSHHCDLGQKLAINVTTTNLSPGGANTPGALGPSAFAPSVNSAPSKAMFGFTAFFLSIAMAFPIF